MTSRLAIVVSAACLLFATPTSAHAQDKSRSQRFFLGASYEGVGVVAEDSDEAESGRGFGITAGYGFTNRLALYTQFSGASVESIDFIDNYGAGHFDIGLRVHFRAPAKTVVPFLQVGVSGRALVFDDGVDKLESSGTGGSFGAGLNAHFTPALAFTTGATWSFGSVGDVKLNGVKLPSESVGMTTARVHFGLIWFPQSQ